MRKSKICLFESDFIKASGIKARLMNSGVRSLTGISAYDNIENIMQTIQPDIILMDVVYKEEKDGIDLASEINEKYNIPIIFLTSNSDLTTFEKARKISPRAYLISPISDENLIASIEIAVTDLRSVKSTSRNQKHIFIKDGINLNKIYPESILYLKSEHVYIKVVTVEDSYLVRTSIEKFIKEHSLSNFIQVQRSFAVNKNYINSVSSTHITIKGVEIPLSRKHRADILKDIAS
jgi:two-component system response regulator LytT